jgi:hypothetical protein
MFVQKRTIALSMRTLLEVAEAHCWNSRFWVVIIDQMYPVHCEKVEFTFFRIPVSNYAHHHHLYLSKISTAPPAWKTLH